jgi:hypothetical protein
MSTFLDLVWEFVNFMIGVAGLLLVVGFMWGIYLIQKDRDIARKRKQDQLRG